MPQQNPRLPIRTIWPAPGLRMCNGAAATIAAAAIGIAAIAAIAAVAVVRSLLGFRGGAGRLGLAAALLQAGVALGRILPIGLEHEGPTQVVCRTAGLTVPPAQLAEHAGELVRAHHQQGHDGHDEHLPDAEAQHEACSPHGAGASPVPVSLERFPITRGARGAVSGAWGAAPRGTSA